MDLPQIGSHCPECNELDLLPIQCPTCKNILCRRHINQDAHTCLAPATAKSGIEWHTFDKLDRCAIASCTKPSLDAFVRPAENTSGRTPSNCPRCQLCFCSSHRHSKDHHCSVPETVLITKNERARQLLLKNFPTTSAFAGPRPTKVSKDPRKPGQNPKIELMKMRHRAIPGDIEDKSSSLSIDQRLHFRVELDIGPSSPKKGVFWFRKTIGTGRALDHLTSQFGIPSSDNSPRQLVMLSNSYPTKRIILKNDKLLMDQTIEGATLIIGSRRDDDPLFE